ncbi:unnamed protein product [Adineta steineri]|uniref:Uncharacterized protein n=1 Tax=Adineta steineri TaxID=433720 RepID=A0A815N2E7_9BILA|nr:unnamed protein product [Adineta steineri]
MLLFTGLTRRGSRQMKVTPVSSSIYYDLKDKYDDMLSCPCSNVTIPYEDFVSNPITSHPVCSSVFISNQWFAALYSTDASKHGVADFRTTASHQFNIDLNASRLLSKPLNLSVEKLLLNLFIDQELPPQVDYPKYFDRCSPSYCIYTTTDEINISYASTLFISLYGSLIVILRFIAPLLIQFYFKLRKTVTNRDIRQNLLMHMKETWMKFIRKMKRLNLFKDINERTEEATQQQRINTRVYLLLLLGIPHRLFMSISPRFHQICTSDLLDERWISLLGRNRHTDVMNDWRNRALTQFKLLSNLCQLAQKTVNDSINRFLLESFVSAELVHETEFTIQINLTLQQFFTSTIYPFEILNNLTHLLVQVDQPFMGDVMRNLADNVPNLLMTVVSNAINSKQSLKVDFNISGTRDINTRSINCVCIANPNCNSPAAMYDGNVVCNSSYDRCNITLITGLIEGCFVFDSLLLSTLECFYSDSFCYRLLMSKVIYAVLGRGDYYPWYAIRPLVYDPTSRYPLNSSIKTILQNLMIEQWNPHNSYEDYYLSCLPTYCIYSQVTNQKIFLKIILSLISLIGGLTLVLRIIVPHIVKFIRRCFRKNRQQQQVEEDEQQQVHVNICNRLRTFLQNTASLVYAKVVELNLFPQRDFGSSFNPEIYQQLGRWATRLYIVCLICSFLLLLVYRIIEPATLTKTFSEPNFERYQSLKEKYKDQLTCICKSFATQYDRFLEIQYSFHQICESEFAANEWRTEITSSIVANLSKYDQRDYRRHLTSHLQYLRGLCQLSNKTVEDDRVQLLSQSLITNELLSENEFTNHFNEFEKQHRLNLPKLFNRLLMLILNMSHGNAFMSTLGTNYQYLTPWDYHIKRHYYYAFTEALLYDHQCSCALSRYCISDAYLFENNSSKTIFIEGMKIGCTPSESFHQSTLQCFYNSSCLRLLVGNSIVPLVPKESRYLINTTVDELRKNLFLENWNTTSNYSAYFHECLPSICSYSYVKKFNLIYLVTSFLTLNKGLSIIFQWICPKIVLMIFYIYLYLKKKRNNSIHPIPSDITAENEDVCETIPSIPTHQ